MGTDKMFEETAKMIDDLYKVLGNSCVEYSDYYQNCAVKFFEDLKSGETTGESIGDKYSKILLDMNREIEREQMNTISFVEDFCPLGTRMCFRYSVMMPSHLERICDLIVDGYNAEEICNITKYSKRILNGYIKEIKAIYINFKGTDRDEKTATI